jgi:hypothetical protein
LQYQTPKLVELPDKKDLIVGAGRSDWHLSERIRKQETNGFNEYNSVIASNMVWHLINQTKQCITALAVSYNVKELCYLSWVK